MKEKTYVKPYINPIVVDVTLVRVLMGSYEEPTRPNLPGMPQLGSSSRTMQNDLRSNTMFKDQYKSPSSPFKPGE